MYNLVPKKNPSTIRNIHSPDYSFQRFKSPAADTDLYVVPAADILYCHHVQLFDGLVEKTWVRMISIILVTMAEKAESLTHRSLWHRHR